MIYLYSDILGDVGGVESYLHALALKLLREGRQFRIAVAEMAKCPLLDELAGLGVNIYRQRRVPGDRWLMRQRVLMFWLSRRLQPGDWVFCVREPMAQLYLPMVQMVHRRGARIAASWMLAPEFLRPEPPHGRSFCDAVRQTDAVISVSKCTVHQFRDIYEYEGPVHVVRYHNLSLFDAPVPLPPGPPWKIAFMGRIVMHHKNLDILLKAFNLVLTKEPAAELHFYGEGSDRQTLAEMARRLNISNKVVFHGSYRHNRDMLQIVSDSHLFVYPSRFEGGPCMTLLEILQAGRFCVASRVGGIPDVYDGHPDVGTLVTPGDPAVIGDAIVEAIGQLKAGRIDGARIRGRYLQEFDMGKAHSQWLEALGIDARGCGMKKD